jgi:hypothetical protein
VTKKIGAVAFQLRLPPSARIHPVFHVSQLKKAIGEHQVQAELPLDLEHQAESFVPDRVLQVREVQKLGEVKRQVLIKWLDRDEEEATWEDFSEFIMQFPEFNLEDKVQSLEGSIVRIQETPPLLRVYSRRGRRDGGI